MRILITGANGRLGSALAETLALAHAVTGLDVRPGRWTTHVGDVGDRDRVYAAAQGVEAIIHTASLHAPMVGVMSKAKFVETNIQGTLNLLDAAVENRIGRFIYTSTTSLYGEALVPRDRAVWVTEELVPQPRDIYDATKIAAEQLCRLFALEQQLPVICLRVARFFPEPPDVMAIYRLYRGVDVRDVVAAHVLALENTRIGFDIFNISARSPFQPGDTAALLTHADEVIARYAPQVVDLFRERGWELPTCIDRVYVITKAMERLGYFPRFNFGEFLVEKI